MSSKRYTEEFKTEAAKQVIDLGRPVREVAERLGVSSYTLYEWVKIRRKDPGLDLADRSLAAENRRLQAELKRVIEERDILKKAAAYFAKGLGQSTCSCKRTRSNSESRACAGFYVCSAVVFMPGIASRIVLDTSERSLKGI